MKLHSNSSSLSTRISPTLGLVLLVILASSLSLAACQTVKGVGKDIQYVGEKTEEALDRAKK